MNDTQEIENVFVAAATTPSPTIAPISTPSLPAAIPGSVNAAARFNGITLEAIGVTLVGGLCIWTITVIAFGLAVMMKHTNIAPRCTARHSNTIWRSRKDILAEINSNSGDVGTKKKKRGRRNKHKKDGASASTGQNNISDVEHGMPTTMPSPQDPPIEMSTYISKQEQSSTETSTDASNSSYYSHPQDRGNPFLGWIPWTLHLSYDRMLRGIPGTGTRNKGMDGQLLGVNLDAIVLFRYNGTFYLYKFCSMYGFLFLVDCFVCLFVAMYAQSYKNHL